MAKEWAKIRADVVESKRLRRLLKDHPFAFGLYMIAKAVSDDYGRISADPDKFKLKAAPGIDVPLQEIAAAIDDMLLCEVVSRYEVDGDVFLELVEYNKVEETNWQIVGAPKCPHPPGWIAPPGLCEHIIASMSKALQQEGGKSKSVPARYHLMLSNCGAYAQQVQGICSAYAKHIGSTPSSLVLSSPVLDVVVAVEEEGNSGAVAPPPDDAEQERHITDGHDPVIQAALAYFTTPNPPILSQAKAKQYGRECRAHLQGNSDFNDAEVIEAFRTNAPQTGNERTFAGNWFERLRRERDGTKQRASPRGKSINEPAPAEVFEAAVAAAGQEVTENVRNPFADQ